jgi:hypothetical protein
MKVNIGPHTNDIIPVYSWERRYEYWRRPETFYLSEEEYTWYDKLVFGFFEKLSYLTLPINRWSNSRKRKINIHIDSYDVWSADHTLALIIHPVLLKLNEQKHGSPCVDDEDVPENLRSTAAAPKQNEWDNDDNHHLRWEWVMDEMIWAFEQCTDEDHGRNQFHHNSDQLDLQFVEVEGKKLSEAKFTDQKDPNKPKYWVDYDGKKLHDERIANGLRLFAKYYFALWD